VPLWDSPPRQGCWRGQAAACGPRMEAVRLVPLSSAAASRRRRWGPRLGARATPLAADGDLTARPSWVCRGQAPWTGARPPGCSGGGADAAAAASPGTSNGARGQLRWRCFQFPVAERCCPGLGPGQRTQAVRSRAGGRHLAPELLPRRRGRRRRHPPRQRNWAPKAVRTPGEASKLSPGKEA